MPLPPARRSLLLASWSNALEEPLQFETGMFPATCAVFWDKFWASGLAALVAADLNQKLVVLQKLTKVGGQLYHLGTNQWKTMMHEHDRHKERKQHSILSNSDYREQELPGRSPPRPTCPEFVQDTSSHALRATAGAMKLQLQEKGIDTENFGEQILQRFCYNENPYRFADFAFSQWCGWALQSPPSEAGTSEPERLNGPAAADWLRRLQARQVS